VSGEEAATATPARRLAARLAHDVGKHAARTAHNVEPSGWTPELADMLCRDLYALPGGRASAIFASFADPIVERLGPQPSLARVRGWLAEIDGLESAVRAGDVSALCRAADLALAVERALRAFAGSLKEKEETP
jgi:hypothetical protein